MNKSLIFMNSLKETSKWLISLLLLSLCSCDTPSKLVFNDLKKYNCYTTCGIVSVSGSTLMTDKIIFSFEGDFVVVPDSLSMDVANAKDKVVVYIYHKDILLKPPYNAIHISGSDTICLVVQNTVPINFGGGTIKLLPSSFILCNDIPIIQESILIRK